MKHLIHLLSVLAFSTFCSCSAEEEVIWQIGVADNSSSEFSLAPSDYERFLEKDFGWEDRYYLVGRSAAKDEWPYVLPGPSDAWGGTWSTSGWRSHTLNILFGIDQLPRSGSWKLVVDVLDNSEEDPPVFKVSVNGNSWKYQLPPGSGNPTPEDSAAPAKEYLIELPIPVDLIQEGGNTITLTTLQGSWLIFDQVRLEGPGNAKLVEPEHLFVRDVRAANYEIEMENGTSQPLLVDVEHLTGAPTLSVMLDGNEILSQSIEMGRYVLEAPMPAVAAPTESTYRILAEGEEIQAGRVQRTPCNTITPGDYVDTKMGTAHSRWMIAPGPWMPFSMVKLSPDNQNGGWQAGYDPIFESVGSFSHIHEWTMAGLSMMPTNGPLITTVGDERNPAEGYRSAIDPASEEAPVGYYRVMLKKYNILAELTATTRCSLQRYTFPDDSNGSRLLIDLQIPAEYAYKLEEVLIRKANDYRLEGFSKQLSPNTWSGGVSQEYTVHFVIEFDQPVAAFGVWTDDVVEKGVDELHTTAVGDAGAFVEFNTEERAVVQVRTGISYVSIDNAAENLEQEISEPFNWDFDAVRQYNLDSWNDLFSRIRIFTSDRREKKRFYTNMYRALCSRNTFSDVNGQWVDADEIVRQLEDPDALALGCDAFWNTFWNLNQFWNLATPEWSSRWVRSQLAMYDAGGWLAKGPAGMEYIPVMVAEHEIPLIVGAYQMGIRDFNIEKAYEAIKKMQTTPARPVGGGLAGNRDLEPYLKYHYVPYDLGRFSNTLEYAFDDWAVSQLALSLGKAGDFNYFLERGNYWRNAVDPETGYARMRKSDGTWLEDFDPYQSGRNHHYVEGNAWQLTFFVPQDVPALATAIGEERFKERLNWGFNESYKWRFNAPNDQYWDYPVMQGNQQSMHFAFLFNWVDQPWLTQKWSRSIVERYYGYGLANAYLGDEDQGQMSAWFIMATLGLFQTDGGCRIDPIYEIGSPLYEKVVIDLGEQYGRGDTFTIEAINASRKNKYIQGATLNDQVLNDWKFAARDLLKGGNLVLEMGPEPNEAWGVR